MSTEMDTVTCREIVELVTDYLEDRLSEDDRTRFARHFQLCDPCVTYVEQMRQVVALTGEIDEGRLDDPTRNAMLEAFRAWRGSQ